MSTVLIGLHAVVLTAALLGPQQGAAPARPETPAQPAPTAPQAPAPADSGIELPVDLNKIQTALSRPPAIRTTGSRPVFRVEVLARKATIEDILGPDYLKGPVPYGSISHREFLDMVTPAEYRGMGVFTGGEAATIAATSIGLQWALMKAIDKVREARTERAKAAARQEVLDAMEKLAAARKKAGLPPK